MQPKLKGYRYPWSIVSFCVYLYHRFSLSYRDIEEMLLFRGVTVSYESIRNWCLKFTNYFNDGHRQVNEMLSLDIHFLT